MSRRGTRGACAAQKGVHTNTWATTSVSVRVCEFVHVAECVRTTTQNACACVDERLHPRMHVRRRVVERSHALVLACMHTCAYVGGKSGKDGVTLTATGTGTVTTTDAASVIVIVAASKRGWACARARMHACEQASIAHVRPAADAKRDS
eukprot:365808-Chlamydomonas_euryale.AAC.2